MAREGRKRKLLNLSPELPTEIIFSHILPRLPPKDLMMQCRCVCKSWSSFICSPSFVADFWNDRNKSTTNFLFQKQNRFFSSKIEEKEQQGGGNNNNNNNRVLIPTPVAELSYLSRCEALQLYRYDEVKSVHGLVCASSRKGDPVFVVNPTTRESIQLPHVKHNAVVVYNFGFSPLTNEYKVLQLINFRKSNFQFNAFTLGQDSSWRPLQVDPAAGNVDLPFKIWAVAAMTDSVCINGAIHWIDKREKDILVFDVEKESFSVVPLSEDCAQGFEDYNEIFPSIIEVGGCVAVDIANRWEYDRIILWILKDYQNLVWVKETITFSEMPEKTIRSEVLGTIHTGELAIMMEVVDSPLQLYLYNMKSKRHRIFDFVWPGFKAEPYGRPLLQLLYCDSIVPLK
ncbi:putative F-box protein [Prunus yedoensis var. nudiflora]|uniref:Putative F-box protein n=1 Tax=Prunus yedoensis var. nudiflora TaxID=2094558 RepID=A0A314XI62_PRUYE|nr:putative F-box protein [Prunus yedoensis var. nudiflora]